MGEIDVPVIEPEVVLSWMDVVRDARGIVPRRARKFRRLALALRPGPVVGRTRTDRQKPWRNARKEFMLVERHLALAVDPQRVVEAEPVLERTDDLRNVLGPRQVQVVELRARAARSVHADISEAGIRDGSPECGLSAAGMSDDRNPLRVDRRNCLEPVERAARAPRPRGDRPPQFRIPVRARLLERGKRALRVAGVVVRRDVPRRERDCGESALDNFVHGEESVGLSVRPREFIRPDAVADQ